MRGALAVFALSACMANAAANWIRIATPSLEILTDSNEKTARAVLHRFETLGRVFGQAYGPEPPVPLRVFVFSSESDFRKYRPNPEAAAFYESDDERDLIVLYEGFALQIAAAHEYIHRLVHRTATPLPPWLEEGVSDFYSTVSVNGAKMEIGKPLYNRGHVLASQPWMSAEDLALGSSKDGQIFYAESWALTHMLSLSPEWSSGMPKFLTLVSDGRDQQDAFREAFGRSMEDALHALHAYIRNPRAVTMTAPPLDADAASPSIPMSQLDATLALADLALHTRRPVLARSLLAKAAKDYPDSPAPIAGSGMFALADNQNADAKREFERAISMGSKDASVYFQLAMLTKDNSLLEKTVAFDPNFAEAHFLLGVRATDNGDFTVAIDHLRRAVAVQPRRFSYWHALGYAEAKSGDRHSASESARRCAILAVTDSEKQMATALSLLAAEQQPPSAHGKKPDVTTPPSWQNRKGDAQVQGVLSRVDCDSTPVRLVIEASSKSLELKVENPAEVEPINAEGVSTTLVCGTQSRPVIVDYFAATGEITRIEFKRVAIIKN